jgi:hypothetical protein
VANGATARDAASPFEVSEPTNGATARDAASPFEVSEPTNGATPVGAASPIEFSEPVRAGESELAQGLWNMVASRGLFKPSDDVASAQTVPTNGSTPAPALAEDHRKSCTLPSSAQPRQVIDVDALPNFKTSFEAWEQLVARIREDDEYVSAVLTEVGLVAMSDGLATIVAPRGSFAHTELTTRPDIRAVVEQASRDHFGREYKIELQEGEPVLPERPSVGLVAAERRRQLKEAVETEAHQDARIQAVIRMFDGHIATTKPLERRSGE